MLDAKENEIDIAIGCLIYGHLKEENKAKLRQKDTDARWTKKNGSSYYGYKNHVKVDAKSKIIKRYTVTSAEVHDSQETE